MLIGSKAPSFIRDPLLCSFKGTIGILFNHQINKLPISHRFSRFSPNMLTFAKALNGLPYFEQVVQSLLTCMSS